MPKKTTHRNGSAFLTFNPFPFPFAPPVVPPGYGNSAPSNMLNLLPPSASGVAKTSHRSPARNFANSSSSIAWALSERTDRRERLGEGMDVYESESQDWVRVRAWRKGAEVTEVTEGRDAMAGARIGVGEEWEWERGKGRSWPISETT